jgi:hypothetical protein
MTETERLALAGFATLPMLGCPGNTPDCGPALEAVELPGTLPDNGDNPTLLEARWLSDTVLELQFSGPLETLSPIDPIDPARFRVMGWNITTNPSGYYYGYNDDCTIYTQYYPIRQISEFWQSPEDASVLRIRMSNPVACATPDDPNSGLTLFYTNDPFSFTTDNNTIRDADGDQLPDIGAGWALVAMKDCAQNYSQPSSGYYYYGPYCYGLRNTVTGSFPTLATMLQIPCPNA